MQRAISASDGDVEEGQAGDTRRYRRSRSAVLVGLVVATLALVTGVGLFFSPTAGAAGDWGPDTCLEGYVWREATPADRVCVVPATRDQARLDNQQAAARRAPGGGPWGPDTCVQGYVWREATPSDHVCVTGDVRAQAWADNASAAQRRNEMRLWHGFYTIPPNCNGDICSSTSTDSIPRFRLIGDRINPGTVTVQLRRLDGTLIRSWAVTAQPSATAPGAVLVLDTGVFNCNRSPDSYFIVRDPSSTRWSAPHHVSSICFVL